MSPSAPPAPWGRSATKVATPTPPPSPVLSPSPRTETAGAVPEPHSRSPVGSSPDRRTLLPVQLRSWRPHPPKPKRCAFLGFQNALSVPQSPPGSDWVPEPGNLPLLCSGARGAGKPGHVHCRLRLLEAFAACKFQSTHSMPCPELAWGPQSARKHSVPTNGTAKSGTGTLSGP